jgi:D-alanine-D-alanine ligase
MKVAVLAGGLSLERDVSLRSGRRVADALGDRGLDVLPVDLDPRLVDNLLGCDVAFLALHGKSGEDGTIQGICEVLGIPYTGPDAVSSAMAWDKNVAKGLLARAGLSTPDWVAVSAGAIRDMGGAAMQDRLMERLGLPLVVKPAQGGAFMGVRFVTEPAEFPAALLSAFSYSEVVLVEQFIDGTEVAVSLLDGQTLPPVEIVPKQGAYDFAARYTHGATDFYAPARLDTSVMSACQDAARRAWDVIGCRQVTRVDMIVGGEGKPWILELDTCPGLTETSLLPMAIAAAGFAFAEVCERLVTDAAAR